MTSESFGLSFMEHAPLELAAPAVFFARAPHLDETADFLLNALRSQEIRCVPGTVAIPLTWLWQHRAYRGRSIGILHFYCPCAFDLTHRQRQKLAFRLRLASCWSIPVITTGAGRWWQSTRGLRFLPRKVLERDREALDLESGWSQYVGRLVKVTKRCCSARYSRVILLSLPSPAP